MKVELEKLRLGCTNLGERICVGIPESNIAFRHKKDVTNDFVSAIIDWIGEGNKVMVESDKGIKYEILLKKLP